ncbi:hypothetical protein ABK040_008104 [Willaertia magna]
MEVKSLKKAKLGLIFKNINLSEIKLISNNDGSILIVTKNNEIFVYGNNHRYILGTGDYKDQKQFIKIQNNNFGIIEHLGCGNFGAFVNNKNEIFLSGLETPIPTKTFTKIHTLDNNERIKFINCENDYLFIVTKNNSIYIYAKYLKTLKEVFPSNNDNGPVFKLNNFPNLSGSIKDIKSGTSHSLLIDSNGNLYGCGSNILGQLGSGNKQQLVVAFTKLSVNFKVKSIACAANYSILMDNFNEIYGTGTNRFGALDGIKNIYTSNNYSIIITNNNNLYVSGYNFDNMFGIDKSFCNPSLDYYKQIFFKLKRKNVKPILLFKNIFFIISDFEIGFENLLGLKYLQKLQKGCY